MTAALRRPELADPVFGLESAVRLLGREILAPWVQDLGLVIEKVEPLGRRQRRTIGSRGRCCVCPLPHGIAATALWCAGRP